MLQPNAIKVLERRYLSRDVQGNTIEDVDGMFWRVARHIASADTVFDPQSDVEATASEFYEMMTSLKFMPNSPTLMNAGKPLGQLSACFVLPIGDSMEEIFDSIKNAALIHKSGGGTGFSFSRLRSAGSSVRSTGGVASGPISFMKVFNAATEAVKQGGTRRGANMGILRVDHPDILEFIDCKTNNNDITNFNISVGITEEFIQAVQHGSEYDLIDPHTKNTVDRLDAKFVFDKIIDAAWRNGEPGIIFLDRLNKDNPVPHLGEIESTNPCGEQPLLPYESCNLGSINLVQMLKGEEEAYRVDWDLLGVTVDKCVHFLDNVIEANKYPLDEIAQMTRSTRKIGLGIMGWADILFRLGIPYNSEEAIALAEELMQFINTRSHQASATLAKTRGVFPAYEGSTWQSKGMPLRNTTTTTIAPTGTISIICGVTSGIEPLFAISYVRNVMDNDELPEVNPYFEQVAKREGFYSPSLMQKIAKEGTIAHIREIPLHIRNVFVTAHDISPDYHVDMQAAFQKYTDNAVSKTVNFTKDATREAVKEVYLRAFETVCKGVTIYRDGSRESQVLNIGAVNHGTTMPVKITPRTRPAVTKGITEKVLIGCGNLYVTVNYDEMGICEVFANVGRAGGCPSQSEATSRLVSIALRSGMEVDAIVEQLKGIRCHSTLRQMSQKGIKVLSCPDAISRVIAKVAKEHFFGAAAQQPIKMDDDVTDEAAIAVADGTPNGECPECGATMEHEGGCIICRACGYSKCG